MFAKKMLVVMSCIVISFILSACFPNPNPDPDSSLIIDPADLDPDVLGVNAAATEQAEKLAEDAKPTVPPTSVVQEALSPTDVIVQDGSGDAFNCNNGVEVADLEVDIDWMAYNLATDILWVQVKMVQALTNDYSFAVILVFSNAGLSDAEGARILYLWELHEGDLRIGRMDAYTGEFSQEGAEISHDQKTATIDFRVPLSGVGSPSEMSLDVFHQGTSDGIRNCDSLAPVPFDLLGE
jgi:hypothetical protein